ncbi:aminotransferase class I/II-fold pyridoxal phosphate-dependent enzyme [Pedobacter sandarakinus]|uniref:aminotransferase class I/II-fold pyridoxal phosphate-dependent enzyme n=1 Tax=Pedobacter sandarakinus TaxID=353156 RepID=UPI0022454E96|nr:8-amino-7-oxononanoate synthase [Pedobacter sandarakinus]MCX2574502.1 8-amino-7-oxononanoate synthase [Pedobacter sandarakinus]
MSKIEHFLTNRLQQRADLQSLRKLTTVFPRIDFSSNDYLGFAKSQELQELIATNTAINKAFKNGSGGSRLLSGNTAFTEYVEQFVADFHAAPSGLIYNSGYDANVGLLSCIPQRGDTIITDELIHASIIDGCRLSYATRYKFNHNNLSDLKIKLELAKGNVFVVVESVYSMDGDVAPLPELARLCKAYGANLIVDEAHATGIFGVQGKGLVTKYQLEEEVFARVITFGKALGVHGAIVLGSKELRDYLINFSRSFIYTTAAPPYAIVAILSAYQLLQRTDNNDLIENIELFRQLAKGNKLVVLNSISAIQGIIFKNNQQTRSAAAFLQQNGFDVRAILSPTVPEGKERLRICLHTYNTRQDIINLIDHLKELN